MIKKVLMKPRAITKERNGKALEGDFLKKITANNNDKALTMSKK